MVCARCGSDNLAEARVCTKCGEKLEALAPGQALSQPKPPDQRKGLSTASLILGILAVFFSWLTGIPAIITGVIALVKKRPGQGRAIAGIVLGAGLPVFSGIVLALLIPNLVLFSERARRSSVKNNMHVVQTVLEAYAVDHYGNYPTDGIQDWEDPEDIVYCYFPGGDPIGPDGEPVYGKAPINPYTGVRYNEGDLADLTQDDDKLDESGQNAQVRSDDDECPYEELPPGNDVQGSIQILGFVPEYSETGSVEEYGICGYGRDVTQPMFDRDPLDKELLVFFVLHN